MKQKNVSLFVFRIYSYSLYASMDFFLTLNLMFLLHLRQIYVIAIISPNINIGDITTMAMMSNLAKYTENTILISKTRKHRSTV